MREREAADNAKKWTAAQDGGAVLRVGQSNQADRTGRRNFSVLWEQLLDHVGSLYMCVCVSSSLCVRMFALRLRELTLPGAPARPAHLQPAGADTFCADPPADAWGTTRRQARLVSV